MECERCGTYNNGNSCLCKACGSYLEKKSHQARAPLTPIAIVAIAFGSIFLIMFAISFFLFQGYEPYQDDYFAFQFDKSKWFMTGTVDGNRQFNYIKDGLETAFLVISNEDYQNKSFAFDSEDKKEKVYKSILASLAIKNNLHIEENIGALVKIGNIYYTNFVYTRIDENTSDNGVLYFVIDGKEKRYYMVMSFLAKESQKEKINTEILRILETSSFEI